MTKAEVAKLKELRRHLEMNNSHFEAPRHSPDLETSYTEYTDAVRAQTRLWRETWILPVLDSLIKKYDK